MCKKFLSLNVIISFFLTTLGPYPQAHADTILDLPAPGTMVSISPNFEPALIKGLTVHQDNPFLFDFIVDPGQSKVSKSVLKDESDRMIKYFFAALTIPDKDVWVNLSPYEKDRMIPVSLGVTAMGRDLLAQDYMLKQVTASLIYPQNALGKTFWTKVYAKAKEMYGTTQIPVNTFNKVWIVPQRVGIYEHGQTAFIVDGHLRVMLEEDYLSLTKHNAISASFVKEGVRGSSNDAHTIGSQVIRQIILPEIEKEINDGKNFATLRQIFYAQALAVWFKHNLKQALLNRVYTNKGTVKGIDQNDATTNEAIYHRYLRAYKKGVFNYIKEDMDPVTQETLPRKYFSGGYNMAQLADVEESVKLSPAAAGDAAQNTNNLVDGTVVLVANDPIAAGKLGERAAAAMNLSRRGFLGALAAAALPLLGQDADYKKAMGYIEKLTFAEPRELDWNSAAQSLKKMKEKAVPALVDNLHNRDANVNTRKWSAYLLGEIGPYETVKPLLEDVINNGGYASYIIEEARRGLAEAERKYAHSKGGKLENLKPANQTPEQKDYQTATESIGNLTMVQESEFLDSKYRGRIISMHERALPALIDNLHNDKADPNTRKWSAYLIGRIGPLEKAQPVLEEVIDGNYPDFVKVTAQEGLEWAKSEKERLDKKQKGKIDEGMVTMVTRRTLLFTAIPFAGALAQSSDDLVAQRYIDQLTSAHSGTINSGPYQALQDMRERAIPALIKNTLNPSANVETRKWSIQLLGEKLSPSTAPLIKWIAQVVRDNRNLEFVPIHHAFAEAILSKIRTNFGDIQAIRPDLHTTSQEDEAEAMSWIHDLRFENSGSGNVSEPYTQLLVMRENALPALYKTLLDQKANTEARKWISELLVEMAVNYNDKKLASWAFWGIVEFQNRVKADPQSTGNQRIIANYSNNDIRQLREKFSDVGPVKPPSPFINQAMTTNAAMNATRRVIIAGGAVAAASAGIKGALKGIRWLNAPNTNTDESKKEREKLHDLLPGLERVPVLDTWGRFHGEYSYSYIGSLSSLIEAYKAGNIIAYSVLNAMLIHFKFNEDDVQSERFQTIINQNKPASFVPAFGKASSSNALDISRSFSFYREDNIVSLNLNGDKVNLVVTDTQKAFAEAPAQRRIVESLFLNFPDIVSFPGYPFIYRTLGNDPAGILDGLVTRWERLGLLDKREGLLQASDFGGSIDAINEFLRNMQEPEANSVEDGINRLRSTISPFQVEARKIRDHDGLAPPDVGRLIADLPNFETMDDDQFRALNETSRGQQLKIIILRREFSRTAGLIVPVLNESVVNRIKLLHPAGTIVDVSVPISYSEGNSYKTKHDFDAVYLKIVPDSNSKNPTVQVPVVSSPTVVKGNPGKNFKGRVQYKASPDGYLAQAGLVLGPDTIGDEYWPGGRLKKSHTVGVSDGVLTITSEHEPKEGAKGVIDYEYTFNFRTGIAKSHYSGYKFGIPGEMIRILKKDLQGDLPTPFRTDLTSFLEGLENVNHAMITTMHYTELMRPEALQARVDEIASNKMTSQERGQHEQPLVNININIIDQRNSPTLGENAIQVYADGSSLRHLFNKVTALAADVVGNLIVVNYRAAWQEKRKQPEVHRLTRAGADYLIAPEELSLRIQQEIGFSPLDAAMASRNVIIDEAIRKAVNRVNVVEKGITDNIVETLTSNNNFFRLVEYLEAPQNRKFEIMPGDTEEKTLALAREHLDNILHTAIRVLPFLLSKNERALYTHHGRTYESEYVNLFVDGLKGLFDVNQVEEKAGTFGVIFTGEGKKAYDMMPPQILQLISRINEASSPAELKSIFNEALANYHGHYFQQDLDIATHAAIINQAITQRYIQLETMPTSEPLLGIFNLYKNRRPLGAASQNYIDSDQIENLHFVQESNGEISDREITAEQMEQVIQKADREGRIVPLGKDNGTVFENFPDSENVYVVSEETNSPALYFKGYGKLPPVGESGLPTINEFNDDKLYKFLLKPGDYKVFHVINKDGKKEIYFGKAFLDFLEQTKTEGFNGAKILEKLIRQIKTGKESYNELESEQLLSAIQYSTGFRWDEILQKDDTKITVIKKVVKKEVDPESRKEIEVTVAETVTETIGQRYKELEGTEKNQPLPVQVPTGIDADGVLQLNWIVDHTGRIRAMMRNMVHNSWGMWMLNDHSVHLATVVDGKLVFGVRDGSSNIDGNTLDNFAGHTEITADGRPETSLEAAHREFLEEYFGIDKEKINSKEADFFWKAMGDGDIEFIPVGKRNGFANLRKLVIGKNGAIHSVKMGQEKKNWSEFGKVIKVPFEPADLFVVKMSKALADRKSLKSLSDMQSGASFVADTLENWKKMKAEGRAQFGPSVKKTFVGGDETLDPNMQELAEATIGDAAMKADQILKHDLKIQFKAILGGLGIRYFDALDEAKDLEGLLNIVRMVRQTPDLTPQQEEQLDSLMSWIELKGNEELENAGKSFPAVAGDAAMRGENAEVDETVKSIPFQTSGTIAIGNGLIKTTIIVRDKASVASVTKNPLVQGGIDLSEEDAALRVTKDANGGVRVNVDPALIARVERDGLSEVDPVIINMQPANAKAIFG